MSAIATTVFRKSMQLFVGAAVVHTALDVLQAVLRKTRKSGPIQES